MADITNAAAMDLDQDLEDYPEESPNDGEK
jgi:hypothetical protein